MIKPLRGFLLSASLILLFSTQTLADPTIITFEDATTANVGNPIGSFYAAQGVTFSNAQFTFVSGFTPMPPSNIPFGGMSFGGITGPTSADPIVIRFSSLQSLVSLTALDISGGGFLMRAYDANGNYLGQSGYASAGPSFPVMFSVGSSSPTVSYIEVFQPLNTTGRPGGVIFDRLTFSVTPLPPSMVPEPASLVLLGLGLSGAATAIGRRKKNDH